MRKLNNGLFNKLEQARRNVKFNYYCYMYVDKIHYDDIRWNVRKKPFRPKIIYRKWK